MVEAILSVPLKFSGDGSEASPRTICMDLDNLLLAIESIDLSAVEMMLIVVEQLNLQSVVPNRVTLWRMRSANPLRKQYQKDALSWDGAKALTSICCAMSRILANYVRLLVNTQQQVYENKIAALGLEQNQAFLDGYVERFRANYHSRMRSPLPLNNDEIQDLAQQLLTQLLFCGGVAGEARLWHTLLQGAA
jgi:hypothetical protein